MANSLGAKPEAQSMQFAAYYTVEGRKALAELAIHAGKDYGMRIGFILGDDLVSLRNGQVYKGKVYEGNVGLAWARASKSKDTLLNEVEKAASRHQDTLLTFMRGDMDEATHSQAFEDVVKNCSERLAKAVTTEEKRHAAASLYFEGEHLHLFGNANYRTFGKLMLNFVLGKSGEPLCDLYDPNQSDGRSPRQLVPMVEEGQKWVLGLSAPQAP
jgi:hypothetical protein